MIRMKLAEWYDMAVVEANKRKKLYYQSWINMGIFERIDGSNDEIWKNKVLKCEKRKIRKSNSRHVRKIKDQEMLAAYKEMIERDSLAQSVLNGSLDKKRNKDDVEEVGLQSGTDDSDDPDV